MTAPKITAVFGDQQIEYGMPADFPTPETRPIARVKNFEEWTNPPQNIFEYYGHGPAIKFMAAVKQLPVLTGWKPIQITEEIALWWLKIQHSVMPAGTPLDITKKTLSHLCGGNIAFTNNTGLGEKYGDRHNYWATSPDDVGGHEPIGLGYTLSVGSTVAPKRRTTIPGPEKDVYAIEAFNASKPASFLNVTYAEQPWKFWIATTISRDPYRINPFPQAGLGVDRRPESFTRVLVPIFAPDRDEVYIPAYWLDLQPVGTSAPVYPYGQP